MASDEKDVNCTVNFKEFTGFKKEVDVFLIWKYNVQVAV